jgi:protein LTV1
VLQAFRSSAEGADALAAARAAALADRLADGMSDGDEEFSTDMDEDEEGEVDEEDSPEEREAKLALQVTRLRLGLAPSQRLRTQDDEELLEQLAAGAPSGRQAAQEEEDDDPTELRPIIDAEAHARDRWDCETIVSTYSNLENRPRLLDESAAPRRPPRAGSRAAANVSSAPQVIRLGKNGLPVDYLPAAAKRAGAGADADADVSENGDETRSMGVASDAPWRANIRRRGETAEERHARKQAVKEGRREARATKKETKRIFKQEAKATQPAHVMGAVRPGTSVTPLL